MNPFPIPPQRGGTVRPEHVIGRSKIIDQLWKVLGVTGFILFAERRFGKSSLIKKMAHDGHVGFQTLYLQVESISTGDALADRILQKAKEDNLLPKKRYNGLLEALDAIPIVVRKAGPIEIEARKLIWQRKISSIIREIISENSGDVLVIFLDEFSLMLDKMEPKEAAQVVAFLREIVQGALSDRLRFVYAGSVGIDLVLDKIRNDGHQIGPVLNHMEAVELEAFDETAACFFCECLELGTSIPLNDGLRKYIFQITDGIPFFIDRIFTNSEFENASAITNEILDSAILSILTNKKKNEILDHFYDRINHYYFQKELAYALLDLLSANQGLELSETSLKSSISLEGITSRQIMDTLDKLFKDNYLDRVIKNDERHFRFKYNLIRRWWKINKA